MTTSGSVNFSIDRDEIIQEVLELNGVIGGPLETPSAHQIVTCSRSMNLIIKQWQGDHDFAPGLKMWSRKRGTLFLQKDQASYLLGPTGDNATASYKQTTIRIAAAALATTLEVVSTTGMTAADYIGIELTSGTVYWTTISSITDSDTLVIPSPGLSSAAAVGKYVWSYTTKLRRPLKILTGLLRDQNSQDTPINIDRDLYWYESLPDKTVVSDPANAYYESQLDNGMIYFDCEPIDVTKLVKIVYRSPLEDFDALTDTPDLPQHWYRPFCLQVAVDTSPKFGKQVSQDLKERLIEALAIAKNADPENTTDYFQPDLD